MRPFILTSDLTTLRSEDTRVIDVPQNLADKQALLSWYGKALELPEYFGANWDAFDECLRDLSWIKERRLVLYHRRVPLEANPQDQKIHIDVLANAALDWKAGEEHEVLVAFDPQCKLKLRAIPHAA